MMLLEHIDFHHQLLDIKHMFIVTYFFRGNLLLTNKLLFAISSKGSFICTFPSDRTGHTTAFDGPVVDHLLKWKKSPNCKCIHHAGSICHARGSEPLQQSALLTDLWRMCHTDCLSVAPPSANPTNYTTDHRTDHPRTRGGCSTHSTTPTGLREDAHSWWLYSAASLGNQAAGTMTQYPTKSHYPDTELWANQSLPYPINAMCQPEKWQVPIL